nr:uncharacterized protein LOC108073143 [Drosophila kikkawai]
MLLGIVSRQYRFSPLVDLIAETNFGQRIPRSSGGCACVLCCESWASTTRPTRRRVCTSPSRRSACQVGGLAGHADRGQYRRQRSGPLQGSRHGHAAGDCVHAVSLLAAGGSHCGD